MWGTAWSQLAKKWKQGSNYELREQSCEQNARAGHSCLERDGNTEGRHSIEEEQLDAIRIWDLILSVFLLQVLSCGFCSPAHGLVATTSSGVTPISWQEARGRPGWRGMSSECLLTEGKETLLWKTHPLNFHFYFYPNLCCWANSGWNVTSEKETVDKSWVKQSSAFVRSLSSETVEILNKMFYL